MSVAIGRRTRTRPRRRWARTAVFWVFAFFLLAGNFKDLSFFAGLPDLTMVLASITLGIVLYNVLKTGSIPMAAVTNGVLFLLIVLPGALQAPATVYASSKVLYVLTLGTLALLTPIVVCRGRDDLDELIWVLCGACSLIALSAVVDPQPTATYEGAPIAGVASSTIELGRTAGLVLIVAVIALATRRIGWLTGVLLAALGGWALLASGSRGPLAAAIAAVLLGLVLAPGSRSKLTVGAAVLVAAGVLWFGLVNAPEFARERIATVTEGTSDSSIGARAALFQAAAHAGVQDPTGLGWGGFVTVSPNPAITYPHDIVLEFFAEAGVLPTIGFLVWVSITWWRARGAARDFPGLATFVLMTFLLINALVSGDLNDNRAFFAAMGLAIVAASTQPIRRTDGAVELAPVPAASARVRT
ncbi:MAG TPA: O-antigen ligase family protein [Actinomycetota bacterium]